MRKRQLHPMAWRRTAVLCAYLLIMLAIVAVVNGCAPRYSDTAFVVKKQAGDTDTGALRVGISPTAAPVIFKDDNDTPAGLEADFAKAIGAELGRDVRFVRIYWPNLITELREQRIDIIMSGMSVTPRRRLRVAFATPYMTIGQQAMVRGADQGKFKSTHGVLGATVTVAVERGSTAEQFARSNMRHARVRTLPTLDLATLELVRGSVDVVIADSPLILWAVKKHAQHDLAAVPGMLNQEQLAWAVHPKHVELLDRINQILAGWKASGELDAKIQRWLPQ